MFSLNYRNQPMLERIDVELPQKPMADYITEYILPKDLERMDSYGIE